MTRINAVVEGQTEQAFVQGPLAAHLWEFGLSARGIVLGPPGHKGGNVRYDRVQRHLLNLLKDDKRAYCATMFDYYGLGPGFPGQATGAGLAAAQNIELAWKSDICGKIPDLRPDLRFIPYLAVHEYEALLFSDPIEFADSIGQPQQGHELLAIRNQFSSPEEIDDSPDTAPSKRILKLIPRYNKVIDGTHAAQRIGLAKMRQECPHFREWLEQLEALEPL